MIFFVTLFIIIGCVKKMGMMSAIGDLLQLIIASIPSQWQLFFAVTLILWVSALISSVVDNVPYITAFIPVIIQLAGPPLFLNAEYLIYSLFYGVVVGGSGTLLGCSGNIIVADMAKKRGYPITFWEFLKISGPFTFVCLFVIWIYVVILCVLIGV